MLEEKFAQHEHRIPKAEEIFEKNRKNINIKSKMKKEVPITRTLTKTGSDNKQVLLPVPLSHTNSANSKVLHPVKL